LRGDVEFSDRVATSLTDEDCSEMLFCSPVFDRISLAVNRICVEAS
jgi:hypothetical protein